jgi:hypothetical protein
MNKIRSTNIEIRNKSESQMIKISKLFEHCDLDFRDCFEFRASNFEFKNFLIAYKNKTRK